MDAEPDLRPVTTADIAITPEDLAALKAAVETLEQSSLAARFSAILGRQVDAAAQILPEPVVAVANKATASALRLALRVALRSLPDRADRTPSTRRHMAYAALSGAAGGALGIASLPLELPVSTTIMLRAIADIARAEGEDLSDPEARLACLEVFALGAGTEQKTGLASESGYLAVRAVLARSMSEASRYLVQRGVADEAAPVLVRLLGQIASRFGVLVGQKVMTQAIPVIGAVTGAAINAAFTDHFQAVARAHFVVRRLERTYGEERIRTLFNEIREQMRNKEEHRAEPAASTSLLSDLSARIRGKAGTTLDHDP